jgi:hypothetical protein
MLHAFIEKFVLAIDDAFDDAVNRLPPVLDVSQQIYG